MALQALTLFCHRCQADTGHTKGSTSHTFHLIMTVLTVGLWLIVWALLGLANTGAAKCSRCGSSYSQRLAVQTSARLDRR